MAKRIIWSVKGKDDKKEILAYWLKRNRSFVYPRKLNKLLDDAIIQLAIYPYPRRNTDIVDVYVKIVRDYKIFFKEDNNSILIVAIWDTRQDLQSLRAILDK